MGLNFVAQVYEHTNRAGRTQLLGLAADARYRAFDVGSLSAWNLQDAISSAETFAPNKGAANLVLFEHSGYTGAFRQVVRTQSSGSTFTNLTQQNFNDKVSSAIL